MTGVSATQSLAIFKAVLWSPYRRTLYFCSRAVTNRKLEWMRRIMVSLPAALANRDGRKHHRVQVEGARR